MTTQWKPGDVAIVRARFGPDGDGPHEYAACRHEAAWALLRGDEGEFWIDGDPDTDCEPIRPLVVIDPEDREQVERLNDAQDAEYVRRGIDTLTKPIDVDVMQAALREFANSKPPKPEEPTGLGAVVEDANGTPWVRCENADLEPHWYARNKKRDYDDLDVVRVLSEGVQA